MWVIARSSIDAYPDPQNEDTISAAVTDGVTVGHPCCNVQDCKEPLSRVTDEFCHRHIDRGSDCCVRGCVMPREPGYRTCNMREHRDEELKRQMRGRKMARAAKDGSRGQGGKKKSVLGSFSRKWTHNEQLMVRPCGVVVGRSTFFGSENVIGVKVSPSTFDIPLTHDLIYVFFAGIYKKHLPAQLARTGARNIIL